jgi:hypothetical protein
VILEGRAGVIGEALRAYLAALVAGRNWLADHPDAAVESLMATGLAESAARAQLDLCGSGPLTASRLGFEVVRELRAGQGLLPEISCAYDDFVSTTQQRKED